jgi:hypothetical protein
MTRNGKYMVMVMVYRMYIEIHGRLLVNMLYVSASILQAVMFQVLYTMGSSYAPPFIP